MFQPFVFDFLLPKGFVTLLVDCWVGLSSLFPSAYAPNTKALIKTTPIIKSDMDGLVFVSLARVGRKNSANTSLSNALRGFSVAYSGFRRKSSLNASFWAFLESLSVKFYASPLLII